MRIAALSIGLALIGALVLDVEQTAATPIFRKIADTNTPIPNGSGNFGGFPFGYNPAIDNGHVVFQGWDTASISARTQDGIYTTVGPNPLNVVADTNTAIPGGTGNFIANAVQGFNSPSISGENIAFGGDGAPDQRGVYKWVGGTLSRVADRNTVPPAGGVSLSTLGSSRISGEDVTFWSFEPSFTFPQDHVLVQTGGGVQTVVNETTFIPNSALRFQFFNSAELSHDDGDIAFQGGNFDSGTEGVYAQINGTLTAIADGTTAIPDGSDTFDFGFTNEVAIDNELVVFNGNDGDVVGTEFEEAGVYLWENGALERIADKSMMAPGGGNFVGFSNVAIDAGNIALHGTTAAGGGIYHWSSGTLSKIIASGDLLDGKTVSGLRLGNQGVSGPEIAFQASFTDGSQGIFVASTIPEPGGLAIAAIGATVVALWRRQRKHAPKVL